MTEAYYTDEKNLEKDPKENRMPASPISVIGIRAAVNPPDPCHTTVRTGPVHGGSNRLR